MKGLVYIIDQTDFEILKLLEKTQEYNGKNLAKNTYDGQAVGNRIRRLEDLGIIEQYTIAINRIKLGK